MGKILNIGSLNIDHVYTVGHFVQPGETLPSQRYEVFPGGKGLNQSIALAQAGGAVFHAGMIGADGAWLLDLMREKSVDVSRVEVSSGVTGHAVIQVNAQGQNCILLHRGANGEITEGLLRRALDGFGPGDLLLLQNEVNCTAEAMRLAHERGVRIALNPSPCDGQVAAYPLELVDWFLLNEVEGCQLTGETEPERIAARMREQFPRAKSVLTPGQDGSLYCAAGQTIRQEIYRVPVVDTTAAGDTFTGYFLASIARGEPPRDALRLASAASALAVSRKGAAVSIPSFYEAHRAACGGLATQENGQEAACACGGRAAERREGPGRPDP